MTDPIEDRVRRTLAVRGEDMASGDGGAWDPSSVPAPSAAGRAPAPRWRRPLLVAAAVSVVAGLAVGGLALLDDDGEVTTTGDDPAATTSTAPTTTTSAPPPIDESEVPSSLGYFVSSGDPNKHLGVIWYEGWDQSNLPDNAEQVRTNDDGSTSWFGTIAPEAGDLFQLWIVYADGVVELQAANMSQDELLSVGVVRNSPASGDFTVTPPPGFVPGE